MSLLSLTLIVWSCQNSNPEIDRNYVVFGSFAGECIGEQCIEIFKIEQELLTEDTSDIYPSRQSLYSGNFVPLPDQSYQRVKDIFDMIPNSLAYEQDIVIGMPDVVDQGGFYLELIVDGDKRFWLIDRDKHSVPAYLHETMDSLDSKIMQIHLKMRPLHNKQHSQVEYAELAGLSVIQQN